MLPIILIFLAIILFMVGLRGPTCYRGGGDTEETGPVEISVQNPWFGMIKSGQKTIEGRLKRGRFAYLKVGDKVKWINKEHPDDGVVTEVMDIKEYDTIKHMIKGSGLHTLLPGVDTEEEALAIYKKYYTEESQAQHKVVAIHIAKVDDV